MQDIILYGRLYNFSNEKFFFKAMSEMDSQFFERMTELREAEEKSKKKKPAK